jgi:carbamoyl-phosphate synthase large subunit
MLASDPHSAETRILLTGAGGSASANVLDSLRRSVTNYWVLGADVSHTRLHLSEASECCLIPLANNLDYIQSVNTALDEFGIDVLHIQPDPELRVVSQQRSEIRANLFLPSDEAIQLASDKSRFADAMLAADVPIPESVSFENHLEIRDKVDDLLQRHERVWVRARVGAGAKASLPVSTAQQAVNWIDWWTVEKAMTVQQFMASEMLPGSEFAFQSVWQDGNLIVGQARERLEYLYGFLAPSGQSSTPAIARTVSDTKVTELATRAIRALDSRPNGIYCVDIKCSQNGSPRVTEINAGRFFTTSNFFAAAGLNMPDMAMKAAAGTRLIPIGLSPLADDLYWIRNVDMNYVMVGESDLNKWRRF